MIKTFYVQLADDNAIKDVVENPHENYVEVQLETPLPAGINGGWYKLIDGVLVEFPELKPKDESDDLHLALAELAEAQMQQQLETQLAIAELAESITGGV